MKKPSADTIVFIGRVIFLSTILLSTLLFVGAFGIAKLYGADETKCMLAGLVIWFFSVPFVMAMVRRLWIKWAIKQVKDIFELQKALDRANLLFLFQKHLQQYIELNGIQPKKFTDFVDDPSVPPETALFYRDSKWVITFGLCLAIAVGITKRVLANPHYIPLYGMLAIILLAAAMSYTKIKDTTKTFIIGNEGIKIGGSFFMWSWIAAYKVSWLPLPQLVFLHSGKRYFISLEQVTARREKIEHLLSVYYGRVMKNVKYAVFFTQYDGKQFVIEEHHHTLGSYLLVFDGGRFSHDYLQNNINQCKECALEEFGVPIDSWQSKET